MVKVSLVHSKSTADKTKTQRKAAANTPKGCGGRSSKVATPAGVDLPICSGCGQVVSDDVRALQCDCCQSSEAWRCIDCLNLPVELYDMLGAKGDSVLKWLCDRCQLSMSMGGSRSSNSAPEGKIDQLLTLIQKLMDTFEHIDARLDEKTDATVTAQIDVRIKSVEERLIQMENRMTSKENRLEEKVDAINKKVEETASNQKSVPVVTLHEDISNAVRDQLMEDKEEEDEVEKRKTNVIVFGIAESESAESDDKIEEDTCQIAAMCHEIKCDEVKVAKVTRLGRKPEGPNNRPRPIKLVMETEEYQKKLLREAKNLKLRKEGGWDKVYVQPDLTPKQQEKRRVVWNELKMRQMEGETNLIIVDNKIVKRKGPPWKPVNIQSAVPDNVTQS